MKNHIPDINNRLARYAANRTLDFHQYSPYHMRIMDGGYTVIDMWTTGRYYIVTTDYLALAGGGIERAGEKGQLVVSSLETWLDSLFFPGVKNG